MATKSTWGTAVPRPAPTTWQQADQYNADDLFHSEGDRALTDRDQAASARDTTRATADKAYSDFTAPPPSNLSRYSAVNTTGYQPTQVAQWLSSMTAAPKPGAGGNAVSVGAVGMPKSAGTAGGSSTALTEFDPKALEDFDPSTYGKQYAEGAYGDFSRNLEDELQTLENKSVGAGRLRTGLFDRDQGTVVTRNTADFNDRLAQAATTFSGQRAGVLTSAEQLRLARAQGIDANTLQGEQIANTAAEQQRQAQIASDRNATDLYSAETSRYNLGLQGAEYADTQGYTRASDLDRYAYNQATGLDAQDATRRQTGLDAALTREARSMQDYQTSEDRATGYASANRDWAAQQRAEQDARDLLAKKMGTGAYGGSGNGSIRPYDPNSYVRG